MPGGPQTPSRPSCHDPGTPVLHFKDAAVPSVSGPDFSWSVKMRGRRDMTIPACHTSAPQPSRRAVNAACAPRLSREEVRQEWALVNCGGQMDGAGTSLRWLCLSLRRSGDLLSS